MLWFSYACWLKATKNLKTNLQFSSLTELHALLLFCNTYTEHIFKKSSLFLSDQIYYLSWNWAGFQTKITKNGKLEKICKIYGEKTHCLILFI